ncbi:MAG: peptide chain release factor-like protein, partial [Planctomycetota bacterium]|nr:peptide chain release factor-like protein [Planctomycetota bacterium]
VSKAHADFPSLIAELLDQWRAHEDQIAEAAHILEITTSQAVKLLKLEPAALEQVNRGRQARGLRPLK